MGNAAEAQVAPEEELGSRASAASPETRSAPLPELLLETQAKLHALQNLPDDALRTIAREQMPDVSL